MKFGFRKIEKISTNPNPDITDKFLTGDKAFSMKEARKLKRSKSIIPFLALISKNKELKKILTPEFIRHVSQWVWKEDRYNKNEAIGLSVASAFFGLHLENSEAILKQTQEYIGNNDFVDITKTSMFTELFKVTHGLSSEQYLLIEMIAANRLVNASLSGLNKEPKDVDLFIFTTSLPIKQNVERLIAQAIGISSKTDVLLYSLACDSSGKAFYDIHRGKHDHLIEKKLKKGKGANIVIFALDDPSRLIKPSSISRETTDSASAQLFSNGASAVSFLYKPKSHNSTFKLEVGINKSIEDVADTLKFRKTYSKWPKKINSFFAKFTKEPENGMIIDMDPKRTGVLFKKFIFPIIKDILETYAQQQEVTPNQAAQRIKKVVMHHPSGTIFFNLVKKLTRSGIKNLGFKKEQFEFVITEGNVPSAILPIALGRQLYDLEPEDLVMFITYGAGGSFTVAIYELGKAATK